MAEFVMGNDCSLAFTVDGEEQEAIVGGIESFSHNVDVRMVEEQIIGRTGRYVSSIFDGLSGDMTVKVKDPAVFDFLLTLQRKAAREVYGVVVNVMATVTFPESGEVRTMLFRNLEFGAIPGSFTRDTHMSLTLSWMTGEKLVVLQA